MDILQCNNYKMKKKSKKVKPVSFWKSKPIPKRSGFKIGTPIKKTKPFKSPFMAPKIPSYLTSHSKPERLRSYIGKPEMLNRMDGKSFPIFKQKGLTKKQLTWPQAKRRFPRLKPMVDTDRDGVINLLDCRPFNKKKQGFSHNNMNMGERVKRAEGKAQPLVDKYAKMDLNERLKFIRENKEEWKRDHNMIHRAQNLVARDAGYAGGIVQAEKEMEEEQTNPNDNLYEKAEEGTLTPEDIEEHELENFKKDYEEKEG